MKEILDEVEELAGSYTVEAKTSSGVVRDVTPLFKNLLSVIRVQQEALRTVESFDNGALQSEVARSALTKSKELLNG